MVSIATKISTFTMLSTMALANTSSVGDLLNSELKVLEDAIKDLNTKHTDQ